MDEECGLYGYKYSYSYCNYYNDEIDNCDLAPYDEGCEEPYEETEEDEEEAEREAGRPPDEE